ncbi:MAG: mercury resistance system transport protein MerF [Deltaproteobacteria bacterium]|nr:mercury resistance system transport protein MerF [Deltaproteobacteria bacterium]MBW2071604.1 mercury resistance system transport protein MerF [Deltaproteobacteria bacterium]
MKEQPGTSKKGFFAALGGTLLVALCCFTPLLVFTLGALGLSTFTPYLDYVLLPSLALLIVLTFTSYKRWRRSSKSTKNFFISIPTS